MAIANGTCVSFCNQPKAHYLATYHESHPGMSLPSADLRALQLGIWLRQENLRHILASPGYAPGEIAVNVTWMERGQTPRCIYPSIFNHFWDIAIYRWRVLVENCDIFLPHLFSGPAGGHPVGISRRSWYFSTLYLCRSVVNVFTCVSAPTGFTAFLLRFCIVDYSCLS